MPRQGPRFSYAFECGANLESRDDLMRLFQLPALWFWLRIGGFKIGYNGRWLVLIVAMSWMGIGGLACRAKSSPKIFSTRILVLDEGGQAIEGALVEFSGREVISDARGIAVLEKLPGPVMAIVRAPGHLAEPIPIGWESAGDLIPLRVLLEQVNTSSRVVIHFGGDAMFGRRYEESSDGTPLIPLDDAAKGARRVVEHLAPSFALADLRSLNLETVVSDLSYAEAYPGKRFLLRSSPGSLAALDELQVDMVTLANNHARDFMDVGVDHTVRELEAFDMAQVGAGLTQEQAEAPLILEVKGLKIGTLAYTSVTGSFVNDRYPRQEDSPPAGLATKDRWMFESRNWGVQSEGWKVEVSPRRIGEAWAMYKAMESKLSSLDRAVVWASMVEVYPELQDWVARRGHGGAAMWQKSRGAEQIADLRDQVDLLVVQFHSGFQFQPAKSSSLRQAARIALDAGADMIIAHHPHVLQGMEWYKGKLIVYSLGNFIFDQDFLSTFASGFVRTIWQDRQLLEARFVPLVLSGYKPLPVSDGTARRVLMNVFERSMMPASSLRDSSQAVRLSLEEFDEFTTPAHMTIEHHTGRIHGPLPTVPRQYRVEAGEEIVLPEMELLPGNLGLDPSELNDILIGRDLFGYGGFEDDAADSESKGGMSWALTNKYKAAVIGETNFGHSFLRMHRWYRSGGDLLARPVARIPLQRHRFWQIRSDGETLDPADPPATYSFRFWARSDRPSQPSLRVDIYNFDDSNPTEDPGSELLTQLEIPFSVSPGEWRFIELDIDPYLYDRGNFTANMLMPYIRLVPPRTGTVDLDIDEFELVEWRPAAKMPEVYGAFHYVKNIGSQQRNLNVQALVAGTDP